MLRNLGKRALVGAFAAALAIAWAAPAVRAADAITDDNVDQAVAAAKTPADHQALAAYFTSKAEAATAKVDSHRRMATAFSGKQKENWRTHCDALIGAYKKEAKEYIALAKQQESLASGK
jgi:hypothetical protein